MPMVTITADGSNSRIQADAFKQLNCGNTAHLDMGGGYPAYRCEVCNALDGSMGQPNRCKPATPNQLEGE